MTLGVLTTNAVIAANAVLVPLQTELLALEALGLLREIVHKIRYFRADLEEFSRSSQGYGLRVCYP